MGGSYSTPHMPFDASFLQSFSNLQVEVTGLQEGYNKMRQDNQRMSGHMESIEEEVTYFRDMWSDKKRERWDGLSLKRSGLWEKPESTRQGGGWMTLSGSNLGPSASWSNPSTLSRAIRGVHRSLHPFLHNFSQHLGMGCQWLWVVSPHLSLTLYSLLHFEGFIT